MTQPVASRIDGSRGFLADDEQVRDDDGEQHSHGDQPGGGADVHVRSLRGQDKPADPEPFRPDLGADGTGRRLRDRTDGRDDDAAAKEYPSTLPPILS